LIYLIRPKGKICQFLAFGADGELEREFVLDDSVGARLTSGKSLFVKYSDYSIRYANNSRFERVQRVYTRIFAAKSFVFA